MKTQINSLLFFLLFSSLSIAAPKIATIDLQKIMNSDQRIKDDTESYKAAKAKLVEDPRKVALDAMAEKIKILQKKIQETKEGSDEYAQINQESKAAGAGYDDLLNNWQTFSKEQNIIIAKTLMNSVSQRHKDALQIAKNIGESKGFDWVLESSGSTNSGMPAVLYIRNSTDITDQVIEKLSKTGSTDETKAAE